MCVALPDVVIRNNSRRLSGVESPHTTTVVQRQHFIESPHHFIRIMHIDKHLMSWSDRTLQVRTRVFKVRSWGNFPSLDFVFPPLTALHTTALRTMLVAPFTLQGYEKVFGSVFSILLRPVKMVSFSTHPEPASTCCCWLAFLKTTTIIMLLLLSMVRLTYSAQHTQQECEPFSSSCTIL